MKESEVCDFKIPKSGMEKDIVFIDLKGKDLVVVPRAPSNSRLLTDVTSPVPPSEC
jgi:hypothetical protein